MFQINNHMGVHENQSRPFVFGIWSFALFISLSLVSCSESTSPDSIPPSIQILAPEPGAVLTETTLISAEASDNWGVWKIEFYVDGDSLAEDFDSPYECIWQVAYWADGARHTISAVSVDNSNNRSQPDSVSVTVASTAGFAPVSIRPRDDEREADPDRATLLWSRVDGAAAYSVEVSRDSTFSSVDFALSIDDTTVTTLSLLPYRHFWRVRAEHGTGATGIWSESQSFLMGRTFVRTFDNGQVASGFSGIQTREGGYALAGETHDHPARSSGWLVLTDETGEIIDSAEYSMQGETPSFCIKGVVQLSGGGFAIAGLGGISSFAWTARVDAALDTLWTVRYPDGLVSEGSEILETASGDLAMFGINWITDDYDSAASRLSLVDFDGTKLWSRNYPLISNSIAGGASHPTFIEMGDGGFILAGSVADEPSTALLLRIDNAGEEIWSHAFSPAINIAAVVPTSEGGAVSLLLDASVYTNARLASTGPNGDLSWESELPVAEKHYSALAPGGSDGYLVAGDTSDGGLFILMVDHSGKTQWRRTHLAGRNVQVSQVQQTLDGGCMVVGTCNVPSGYGIVLLKADAEGRI